jgi:hypothetical protein
LSGMVFCAIPAARDIEENANGDQLRPLAAADSV